MLKKLYINCNAGLELLVCAYVRLLDFRHISLESLKLTVSTPYTHVCIGFFFSPMPVQYVLFSLVIELIYSHRCWIITNIMRVYCISRTIASNERSKTITNVVI